MFCAFIDYSKAFDSVWRPGLWYKLIKSGITGKMYTLIYNMYQDIRSCVAVNGECSQFFNSYIGVRQGENLSPMLFYIFVNDLEKYLIENDCEQLSFNDVEIANFLKITVLLYAGRHNCVCRPCKGLAKSIKFINQYCEEWKLTVNKKKTKIMIFSRGKYSGNVNFTLNNKVLDIVDDFKYLGVTLSRTGMFKKCRDDRYKKAQRAIFSLPKNIRLKQLPIDVQLQLFDSVVLPELLYGCEIWGFENLAIIEKVHIQFLKYTLHLKNSTPLCMIYGELGRLPIECEIKKKND